MGLQAKSLHPECSGPGRRRSCCQGRWFTSTERDASRLPCRHCFGVSSDIFPVQPPKGLPVAARNERMVHFAHDSFRSLCQAAWRSRFSGRGSRRDWCSSRARVNKTRSGFWFKRHPSREDGDQEVGTLQTTCTKHCKTKPSKCSQKLAIAGGKGRAGRPPARQSTVRAHLEPHGHATSGACIYPCISAASFWRPTSRKV